MSSSTDFHDPTGRLTSTGLRSNDHSVINLHEYAYNAGSPREMAARRLSLRPSRSSGVARHPRVGRLSHGASQRILGTRTNASVGSTYSLRNGYAYDDGGQLTVAWVTNSAGGLESGESRGYAYDFAQNLSKRTNNGAGSYVSATVNALNQLTSGLGFSGSLVHDRRGNLLTLGGAGSGKAFAYDHENQCVTAGYYNAYNKSDFVYDGKGRLRVRKNYAWTWGGSYYYWLYTGETRYVYDGMLLVQERNSGNTPTVGYTRGLDLSGTLEGAGGIGGLLGRSDQYQGGSGVFNRTVSYHTDGGGNVWRRGELGGRAMRALRA